MNGCCYAALELGGTKTVAALGTAEGGVSEEIRYATTGPEETLALARDWWRERLGGATPAGIGVAAFGPVVVDPLRGDYGTVLATPKPHWAGSNLRAILHGMWPDVPCVIDTDVNAAALAETVLGTARGHRDAAYITVGTGIGAGIVVDGKPVHGGLHPEFGHLRVPRYPGDGFAGVCPFHGACLEGLASGTAIAARWHAAAASLPAGHPAWDMEAWYLAHGVLCLAAITSPAVVVLGGGVSQAPGLPAAVGACLRDLAGGYFPAVDTGDYVRPPALGQQAGIIGALLLAGAAT